MGRRNDGMGRRNDGGGAERPMWTAAGVTEVRRERGEVGAVCGAGVGEAGSGLGAVRGEIPVASTGMTIDFARGGR